MKAETNTVIIDLEAYNNLKEQTRKYKELKKDIKERPGVIVVEKNLYGYELSGYGEEQITIKENGELKQYLKNFKSNHIDRNLHEEKIRYKEDIISDKSKTIREKIEDIKELRSLELKLEKNNDKLREQTLYIISLLDDVLNRNIFERIINIKLLSLRLRFKLKIS
ncbi:MAG: hypothetical protein ACTSQG_00120 [Promethearchaeota archaeon]